MVGDGSRKQIRFTALRAVSCIVAVALFVPITLMLPRPSAGAPAVTLTMARNAWLNAAKREDYRKTSELKEDGAVQQDRGLERRELETAIEKSLTALDEPIREVFILSRYHGLKYSQIAQMMGISVKTVEARLSRALQDLQKLLKDFL